MPVTVMVTVFDADAAAAVGPFEKSSSSAEVETRKRDESTVEPVPQSPFDPSWTASSFCWLVRGSTFGCAPRLPFTDGEVDSVSICPPPTCWPLIRMPK